MVIVSGNWAQYASDPSQQKEMSATGILICHDNSFPFQERTLCLEQPVKIGRSVARVRATTDNAIFDCKVLSRNHAVLWYDSGKFYLKDTKSSNGTFVNNKRLSPSGEESIACEVCSGDVVQFGVDVVESTKKVTHGCIVATLKLYLPDGKEAKTSLPNSVAYVNVTLEDLYKLNQFIQEAGRRENALKSKLEYMQQLLENTKVAANQSWKALVLEDCLLSRLEMLENQVMAYSKTFGDDKLRIELIHLMEDKVQYQNATKELLQKKVQEKREIISKVQVLKCRLNETEEETQSLQSVIKDNQNELQELAIKHVKVQQILQGTTEKLNKTKNKLKEIIQQSEKDKQEFTKKLEDQKSVEKNLQISLRDSKLDTVNIYKQISALRNYLQSLQDIKYVTGQGFQLKDCVNPIDDINIVLNKWNSMCVKISNNEFQDSDNQQENQINSLNTDLKFENSNIDYNFIKQDHFIDLSSIENNDYILPPFPKNNVIRKSIIKSNNLHHDRQNQLVSRGIENLFSFTFNRKSNIQTINENVSVSEIGSNIYTDKQENIGSVKLIMSFNHKNDYCDKKFPKNNHFITDTNCIDSQNLLSNSLSTHIIKLAQQINNMQIEPIYWQNNYIINALEPTIDNHFSLSKYSQEFILKNICPSHEWNSLVNNRNNSNYNIIQELQDFKNWLQYESNEIILEKLKQYYLQIENENQQVQELSEQLVILKEKYNLTIEEKVNISQKYTNLESQCKEFINATYMVPIYYVVPIIFGLIWMLLEKIL